MDKSKKSAKRTRRSFTSAFKAEAVRLCRVGDRNIGQVASDLNLTETAVRDWVRRAEIDAGNGLTGTLTSDERDELARLRRENKRVLMDLEILKKRWRSSREETIEISIHPCPEVLVSNHGALPRA